MLVMIGLALFAIFMGLIIYGLCRPDNNSYNFEDDIRMVLLDDLLNDRSKRRW